MPLQKKLTIVAAAVLAAAATAAALLTADYFNLIPKRAWPAERFGIETLRSDRDADGDGIDDYTDILLSARAYIGTAPVYRSAYYVGGYPPEGEGVCTDVIWRALAGAGYDLKALVDADIAAAPEAYPAVKTPDPNIDFRRVRNLRVYFERHLESLTTDVGDVAAWQPGDIAVFEGHIGIVSDKRDFFGHAWLIHHGSGTGAEEDALEHGVLIGHYRWREKE